MTKLLTICSLNIKDPVPFTKKHDVIINQFVQLKAVTRIMLVNALEGYMSVEDQKGRDHSSHLVKHAREHCHLPVETANLEKIESGYRKNARHRKIAEALLVKKLKPTLNIQCKSVLLKLFS